MTTAKTTMTTPEIHTMTPHLTDLFAAFCRAFLAELGDNGAKPTQLPLLPQPVAPVVAAEPENVAKRRRALPRLWANRPHIVRADGQTAALYASNEYVAIARKTYKAAEYGDSPPCVWLTETESKAVSAIATYRGQTAGRTKARTPPTTPIGTK